MLSYTTTTNPTEALFGGVRARAGAFFSPLALTANDPADKAGAFNGEGDGGTGVAWLWGTGGAPIFFSAGRRMAGVCSC